MDQGSKKLNMIRDWCASRQRYWGCPIPIVTEDGKVLPVDEEDLPILLPEEVDFTKRKGNPLDSHPTWKHTICKKSGLRLLGKQTL